MKNFRINYQYSIDSKLYCNKELYSILTVPAINIAHAEISFLDIISGYASSFRLTEYHIIEVN